MKSIYYRANIKINKLIKLHMCPPIRGLLLDNPQGGGRNNIGKINNRRRAGRVKRFYRLIDFNRSIWNIPSFVLRTEYDPNRTGFINLICYINGILTYILATEGVNIGKKILNTENINYLTVGNSFFLEKFPEGSFINSLELRPFTKSKIARAAGTSVLLLKKFGPKEILVRFPSKEEVFMDENCLASLGRVSNGNHRFIKFYKAGQKRLLGIKPVVRGVARNPIDHPHGGGGGKHLLTFWSKTAKNFNTRKRPLSSNIVLSRKKRKKRKKK